MNREKIMDTIRMLSGSKGFYGRLLESLMDMDEESFDEVMSALEEQNFGSPVDLVMFLEG